MKQNIPCVVFLETYTPKTTEKVITEVHKKWFLRFSFPSLLKYRQIHDVITRSFVNMGK